jgi:hypothetical protein
MPAYNFQKQFVPLILDGSKTHTIRRRRKYPTKVGDILSLYIGQRTKNCQLIAEVVCVDVLPCVIWPWEERFAAPIHTSIYDFFKSDGFTDAESFFNFFKRYKQDRLDDFEIIYWDPKKMIKADEFISRQCKCAVVEVKHETR